jgi:hypothetical protein
MTFQNLWIYERCHLKSGIQFFGNYYIGLFNMIEQNDEKEIGAKVCH